MTRDYEVAYIAGVADSDGYFSIHKNSTQNANPIYSPKMGINQVEPQAVILAHTLFGGNMTVVDYKNQVRFSPKPMYAWALGSNGLIVALYELIPFLRIKKEQARILLALQENIREWKVVRPVKGHSGVSVYPPEVYTFREECYNKLRQVRVGPVAETKSEGSNLEKGGDAIVRTPTMSKLETEAEMTSALTS